MRVTQSNNPQSPPSKIQTREHFGALINTPGIVATICKRVAGGESLIELAEEFGVHHCDQTMWIRLDPDRKAKYEEAIAAHDEWLKMRVILELRHIAFASLKDLYDNEGKLKPVAEWPKQAAQAVAALESDELFQGREKIGLTRKVKQWDKLKALELIGRTIDMFSDKSNVTVEAASLEALILLSLKRA